MTLAGLRLRQPTAHAICRPQQHGAREIKAQHQALIACALGELDGEVAVTAGEIQRSGQIQQEEHQVVLRQPLHR